MFDINKIRADFPLLQNYPKMVYFDNAATTQKPQTVIDSQIEFYTKSNSNIHRANYSLANNATLQYEAARIKVQKFIQAEFSEEIIFTKGTTESINIVARSLSSKLNNLGLGEGFTMQKPYLDSGDEIIVSRMEHHSNLLPWQIIAAEKALKIRFIEVNQDGELDLDSFKQILTSRTKIVALCHVSNTLGTINPIKEIISLSHQNGSLALVDGAQAASHLSIDVQNLDVDFYCFSGHKLFGPTGVGVLYAKKSILEILSPVFGGGDMVDSVQYDKVSFNQLPYKFEAGTPNIAGVIGLGAALDYLDGYDRGELAVYESELFEYLKSNLNLVAGIKLVGQANPEIPIQSFEIEGIHPYDLAIYLGEKDVCMRSGFHCSQPLLEYLGFNNGVCRISLSFYNTFEEIDKFLFWLKKGVGILR